MKKKIRMIYLTAVMLSSVIFMGCSKASDSPTEKTTVVQEETDAEAVEENSDVDAVSSASVNVTDGEAKGLVRILAKNIQERTGGDLFSIQTSVDYPGDIDALVTV